MKKGLMFVCMCLLFSVLLSAVIIGLTPRAKAAEPYFKDPVFIDAAHAKSVEQGYSLLQVLPNSATDYQSIGGLSFAKGSVTAYAKKHCPR